MPMPMKEKQPSKNKNILPRHILGKWQSADGRQKEEEEGKKKMQRKMDE
jgi:hypothetical protein